MKFEELKKRPNLCSLCCLVKKANTQWQNTAQLPESSPSSVSSSESVSPGHYASDLNNSKAVGSTGMLEWISKVLKSHL